MQAEPSTTPRMSSWGKINSRQSYNILTHDIDRAISFARLSKTEIPFLEQVREACWSEAIRAHGRKRNDGWPDAEGCQINLTALAALTGISRQQWSVARKNLVASKILLEDENGTLRINKNADEWVRPTTGKARLSAQLIQFCRSVQPGSSASQQAFLPFTHKVVNPRSPHQSTVFRAAVDFNAPQRNPCGDRNGIHAVTATESMRSEPVAYRNGREEDIQDIRKEAAALPAAAVLLEAIQQPQPVPVVTTSKAPLGPGADSPEAIALGEWAARFGDDVAHLARQWCDDLPAGWIRLAIQRKVAGQPARPGPKTVNLLGKILCDWMQSGVCEFLLSTSTAPRNVPAPLPIPPVVRVDPARKLPVQTAAEKARLLEAFRSDPNRVPLIERLKQYGRAN